MRRLPIALAGVLVLALGAVAVPPAQAAPCDAYPPDIGTVKIHPVWDSAVLLSVPVTSTCGTILDVDIELTNTTEGTATTHDLEPAAEANGWGTPDDFPIWLNPPYGTWVATKVIVTQESADGPHTKSGNLAVLYNRYPTSLYGSAGTIAVKEGDSIALYANLYLNQPQGKEVHLETKVASETTWNRVDSEAVDNNGRATFIYVPTASVQFRFAYDQTEVADGAASQPGVINFAANPPPPPPPAKPPSAPPAFITKTTPTTIALNWAPPADPNGTVSAYRFGWSTPSGKPVPSWEDTYPVAASVPDPFSFTNLNPDTGYSVWVEAVNENGRSERTTIAVKTDKVVVSPPPPPPCDPAYPDFCIPPPPPDKNCTDFTQKNFTALAPDPHHLDADKDGIACDAEVVPPPPPPPVKRASVYVAAVSKAGKLYVNVNPDKGKGYWKFRVQKLSGKKWVNKSVYKTKTSKETRTINLKKGVYRVVVYPKYGYKGTTSQAVRLKK